MANTDFLYKPRDWRSIDLWKDVTPEEWYDSKWQLRNLIKDVDTLAKVIKLNEYQFAETKRVIQTMHEQGKEPFRITPYYASLMQEDPFHPKMLPGEDEENRLDPIFWQSVPTPAHLMFPDTGLEGAMDEEHRSYGSAYQRYPNRLALFVAENTSCASYCTHCQRAKSLDEEHRISSEEINKGLFYINWNKNIEEVLITGGDALMIGKKRLQYILEELSKIDHLRVIRIATRVPVVMPMAITDDWLQLIKESGNRYSENNKKYIYFMTHLNHYHEITEDFRACIERIHKAGFTIRNQTVFLRHVNSNFKTLGETFRRMFWVGLEPYYLLQCHKERGIVHFIEPIQNGKIFMKNLQGWISGMMRPTYAANVEGGGGKIVLMPSTHHTLGDETDIEDKIGPSQVYIQTWDKRDFHNYEALGRTTQKEYEESVKIMDKYIGREGIFAPCLILNDKDGHYIKTTNRDTLPKFSNTEKAHLFEYGAQENGMPITNPHVLCEELDKLYYENKAKEMQETEIAVK
jgi:lysine 2,3-aminomutase